MSQDGAAFSQNGQKPVGSLPFCQDVLPGPHEIARVFWTVSTTRPLRRLAARQSSPLPVATSVDCNAERALIAEGVWNDIAVPRCFTSPTWLLAQPKCVSFALAQRVDFTQLEVAARR